MFHVPGFIDGRYKDSWTPCQIAGMHYVHNVICLTRKTIKLRTHSVSFRCAMQRKGGRTRSLVILRGCLST